MSPCQPELLDELIGGELASSTAAGLQLHLAVCRPCAAELSRVRKETALFTTRRTNAPSPPATLWENVQQRIARGPRLQVQWKLATHRWELLIAGACAFAFAFPALHVTLARGDTGQRICAVRDLPTDGQALCTLDRAAAAFTPAPLYSGWR